MPDVPHHITQRGIRRSNVFLDESDRQTYLNLFVEKFAPIPAARVGLLFDDEPRPLRGGSGTKKLHWKTFRRCHTRPSL